MPTSIEHNSLLYRTFSILLLVTNSLKRNHSLTRLVLVFSLIVNVVPVVHGSAAQAASLKKSPTVPTIAEFTTQLSQPALINSPTEGRFSTQPTSLKKSPVIPTIAEFSVQRSQAAPSNAPSNAPTDGMYLYGQASEAGQIGSTYIVFETRDAKMVGALYMPYSSFDCFYGSVEDTQLAMTVISSYDQEAYPYSIAIHRDSAVANASGFASDSNFNLEGFHQIDELDEMAQHVLGVCQAEYPDQVW